MRFWIVSGSTRRIDHQREILTDALQLIEEELLLAQDTVELAHYRRTLEKETRHCMSFSVAKKPLIDRENCMHKR
jgi:hypothetical protein